MALGIRSSSSKITDSENTKSKRKKIKQLFLPKHPNHPDRIDFTAYPPNYVWSDHLQRHIDPDQKNKRLPPLPKTTISPNPPEKGLQTHTCIASALIAIGIFSPRASLLLCLLGSAFFVGLQLKENKENRR